MQSLIPQAYWIGLLILASICTPDARANSILYTYTYTGNVFSSAVGVYDTNDYVHGYFTLTSPLGSNFPYSQITPLTFSYFDGHVTVDSSNYNSLPGYIWYYVSTDDNGNVQAWRFQLLSQDGTILTFNTPGGNRRDGGYLGLDLNNNGENSGNPGVWVVSATVVPEPSTFFPLSLALLAIAFKALRR